MSDYKNAVCHIVVNFNNVRANNGTGFFIDNGFILTCYHNLQDINLECSDIKGNIYGSETPIELEIVDYCDKCDVALLRPTLQNNEEYPFLSLVSSSLVENQDWKLFGFPSGNTRNGETLNGTIQQITSITSEHKYDIDLFSPTNMQSNYAGFSGSPILNNNFEIIGVFGFQETRVLQAVSIKKCSSFLTKNGIDVNDISFGSFDEYKASLFNGFRSKSDCDYVVETVVQATNPNTIVNERKEKLFFPEKKGKSVEDIITHIKSHEDCSENTLWKGWLRLLTYVEMLQGNYTDINNIQITLSQIEIENLFIGMSETIIKSDLSFSVSFFFVENETFFNIAQRSLRDVKRLNKNTISVFNSKDHEFDFIPFTYADKIKIVPQIADSINAGMHIPERIHIGVLPLRDLSQRVAGSSSLEDAVYNLSNLIQDAIK